MLQAKKINVRYNDQLSYRGIKLKMFKEELFYILKKNNKNSASTITIFLKSICGEQQVNNFSVKTNNSVENSCTYLPKVVQLYKNLSGFENLDFYCQLEGKSYTEKELNTFLKEVCLDEKWHHRKLKEYSKEMRLKIIKAIALAKDASYVLINTEQVLLETNAITNDKETSSLSKEKIKVLKIVPDIFKAINVCEKLGTAKDGFLIHIEEKKETRAEVEILKEISFSV